MKIKKIISLLFFCVFLSSCSDNQQEHSRNDKNNQKKENMGLENSKKTLKEIRIAESKENQYSGWFHLKETEEKKLKDFCQKTGSYSHECCVDSLKSLIQIKYDSLSQTELFRKMKKIQQEKQKKYAEQIAKKYMPSPPGPESFFRLIAIKYVLEEK